MNYKRNKLPFRLSTIKRSNINNPTDKTPVPQTPHLQRAYSRLKRQKVRAQQQRHPAAFVESQNRAVLSSCKSTVWSFDNRTASTQQGKSTAASLTVRHPRATLI
eukprot:PhF_6_TR36381/c1_g1_i3/m.53460